MPSSITEDMLLSTVKIEATVQGRVVSTGTGFFWGTGDTKRRAISLITNKHVIDGADGLIIHVHVAEDAAGEHPSGKTIRMNIERDPVGEMPHPDADVDLIAMNMSGLLIEARERGHHPCYRFMDANSVPDEAGWQLFDSVEDVLMVGCPRGISDEHNHMPLVRRGITATSVKRDFNGKKEFMVDLACFPGSSGSPVIFYNREPFLSAQQADGSHTRKPPAALLGILHAGPLVTNEGRIVLNQAPSILVDSMMHLGQVIRATRLLEIDELILRAMDQHQSP